jgi:hypothetical protein
MLVRSAMNWAVPTLAGIQRTTAIVIAIAAAILAVAISPASAIACVLGGALMIANLYFLAFIGRMMLAVARESGGPTGLGMVAAPLKMLFLVTIVYAIISSGRVDVPGFIAGVLTQFAAIFIETWRASALGARVRPEDQDFGAG